MKKYLLLISMVSVILFSFGIKADLILSPNNMSFNQIVNQPKTYSINITNTYAYPIYYVSFTNLPFMNFPNNVTLQNNETQQIFFTINTNESMNTEINSLAQFKYQVDLPQEITTYNVNISSDGFSPVNITIRQGDTIIWHNIDDISHTVTSGSFDMNIEPNATGFQTINSIGIINYQDLNMFYGGQINVINRTAPNYAHNPDFDKNFDVKILSVLNPTNLSLSTDQTNYTISPSLTDQGVLYIKNIGIETAETITINSDPNWLTFDSNSFNLDQGKTKRVLFTIRPLIYNTNMTNQTYNLQIKVTSLNSMEKYYSLSIYIPYSNTFDLNDTSNIGYLNYLKNVFCPLYPTSFLCNQSVVNQNNTPNIIYMQSQFSINDSQREWDAMKKKVTQLADSQARTDNKINAIIDQIQTVLPNIDQKLNQSNSMQVLNKQTNQDQWDAVWIFGLGIFVIICAVGLFFGFRNYKFSKGVIKGNFMKE